jgi:hypothetical protein
MPGQIIDLVDGLCITYISPFTYLHPAHKRQKM